MNQNLKAVFALAGALCAFGLACAQAEDNTSTIISGVSSNNAAADFYAGNTGVNNYLQIDGGGQLFNVKDAYIGNTATAIGNSALVTDASSLLGANNRVYVGNSGKSNSLTVANGASVVANAQVIFGFNAGSDGNRGLVTGAGSVLQANGVNQVVGRAGSYNSLTISNGGAVLCTSGTANQANFAIGAVTGGGSNNWLLVTGPGSACNLNGIFSLGAAAGCSYNTVTITNGGAIEAQQAIIFGNNATANNNSALVTGNGSSWSGKTDFYVGLIGAYNRLTVKDGAVVNALNSLVIGNAATTAMNNAVTVTGTNSVWSTYGVMYLGTSGAGNSLSIADGGAVSSGEGYIGTLAGAHYNSMLVSGAGSTYASDSALTLGAVGVASSNSVTIANGGKVTVSTDLNVGTGAGAAGNTALVSGAGSLLDVTGAAVIGTEASGQGNSLTVANGGTAKVRNVLLPVADSSLYINGGVMKAQSTHYGFINATAGRAFIQAGGAVIDSNDKTIRIAAPLEEDAASLGGGLTKIGGGVLELSGANSYTGGTTVEAGGFGGACSLLSPSLVVKSGATLMPGSGIGTLAVAGGVTNEIGSTTVLELTSDSLARDEILSSNNIALGGTLIVTNLGTASFTNGQTFVLYQSLVGISGSFSATTLPTLSDPNLTWKWILTPVSLPTTPAASLALSVAANVPMTPTNIAVAISATSLNLTWPESYLGWYVQSNSASLASPASWFDIPGSQNSTSLSIPLDPTLTNVFYRMRYPQ